MPAAPNRSGIWTGLAIAGAGALCIAAGWWLGQLQAGSAGSDPSRTALERQASSLQQRLNQGEASQAEQQRLLELLVALDRKAEATELLERLADQQPQQWSLRLLLAELRRDQQDRSGAEREVRQLLNLRPDQIEGLQLMALLQLEMGREALAQSQLEAALQRASKPQLKPEALPIGLLLANLLQKRGHRFVSHHLLKVLSCCTNGNTIPNRGLVPLVVILIQQLGAIIARRWRHSCCCWCCCCCC